MSFANSVISDEPQYIRLIDEHTLCIDPIVCKAWRNESSPVNTSARRGSNKIDIDPSEWDGIYKTEPVYWDIPTIDPIKFTREVRTGTSGTKYLNYAIDVSSTYMKRYSYGAESGGLQYSCKVSPTAYVIDARYRSSIDTIYFIVKDIYSLNDSSTSDLLMRPKYDINEETIGGFEYGIVRRTDEYNRPINKDGEPYGSGWEENVYMGVIPNSIWTRKYRPSCYPYGMAHIRGDLWMDIYPPSERLYSNSSNVVGRNLEISRYEQKVLEGTYNWYGYIQKGFAAKKRLASYAECCLGAIGVPNRIIETDEFDGEIQYITDCNTQYGVRYTACGAFPYNVSAYNIRDMVGDRYIMTSDLLTEETDTTDGKTWKDDEDSITGDIGTESLKIETGIRYGSKLRYIAFGGQSNSSSHAGCRSIGPMLALINISTNQTPRYVASSI